MNDAERTVAGRERILATLRRVLVEDLQVEMSPEDMDPDTPLFGTGVCLDSVGALEIVVCLEEAFDVTIPDDPRVRPALRTLNTVIDFIQVLETVQDARGSDPGDASGPGGERGVTR